MSWPTAAPMKIQTSGHPIEVSQETTENGAKKRKTPQEMQGLSSEEQIKEMAEQIASLQETMEKVSFSCGETTNHTTLERSLIVMDRRMANLEGALLDQFELPLTSPHVLLMRKGLEA